jgi:hypothetical protein
MNNFQFPSIDIEGDFRREVENPTFAEATENQRLSKAMAALDILITHYDMDNRRVP